MQKYDLQFQLGLILYIYIFNIIKPGYQRLNVLVVFLKQIIICIEINCNIIYKIYY